MNFLRSVIDSPISGYPALFTFEKKKDGVSFRLSDGVRLFFKQTKSPFHKIPKKQLNLARKHSRICSSFTFFYDKYTQDVFKMFCLQ